MTADEKQYKIAIARDYWLHTHYSQKEIAEKIGVSIPTLAKWKDEGKWDESRQSILQADNKLIYAYCKIIDMIEKELEKENPNVDTLFKYNSLRKDLDYTKGDKSNEISKVGIALIKYCNEVIPDKKDTVLDLYRNFAEWYSRSKD